MINDKQTRFPPIVIERYFAASPAAVFAAWTDPSMVKQWFGPAPNSLRAAEIDLRVGGGWKFIESLDQGRSVGFEGMYLEIASNERLSFTWTKFVAHADGHRETTPESSVLVTFSANGTGTDVRVIHRDVHDEPTHKGFTKGWGFAMRTMAELWSVGRVQVIP